MMTNAEALLVAIADELHRQFDPMAPRLEYTEGVKLRARMRRLRDAVSNGMGVFPAVD